MRADNKSKNNAATQQVSNLDIFKSLEKKSEPSKDVKISETDGVTFVFIPESHNDRFAAVALSNLIIGALKAEPELCGKTVLAEELPSDTDSSEAYDNIFSTGQTKFEELIISNKGITPSTPRVLFSDSDKRMKSIKEEMMKLVNGNENNYPDVMLRPVEDPVAHQNYCDLLDSGLSMPDPKLASVFRERDAAMAKNIVESCTIDGGKFVCMSIGSNHLVFKENNPESFLNALECKMKEAGLKSNIMIMPVSRSLENSVKTKFQFLPIYKNDIPDGLNRLAIAEAENSRDCAVFVAGPRCEKDEPEKLYAHVVGMLQKKLDREQEEDRQRKRDEMYPQLKLENELYKSKHKIKIAIRKNSKEALQAKRADQILGVYEAEKLKDYSEKNKFKPKGRIRTGKEYASEVILQLKEKELAEQKTKPKLKIPKSEMKESKERNERIKQYQKQQYTHMKQNKGGFMSL